MTYVLCILNNHRQCRLLGTVILMITWVFWGNGNSHILFYYFTDMNLRMRQSVFRTFLTWNVRITESDACMKKGKSLMTISWVFVSVVSRHFSLPYLVYMSCKTQRRCSRKKMAPSTGGTPPWWSPRWWRPYGPTRGTATSARVCEPLCGPTWSGCLVAAPSWSPPGLIWRAFERSSTTCGSKNLNRLHCETKNMWLAKQSPQTSDPVAKSLGKPL